MICTEIEKWALLLIFTAVCGMLYDFLLPSGKVSDTAKKVISIAALSAVCMPVFGVLHFIGDPPELPELTGRRGNESFVPFGFYTDETEAVLEEQCGGIIKKYTSVPYRMETDINIGEDGSIRIEYVRIVFDAHPEQKESITEELSGLLGVIPDIRVNGTDE